MTLIYAMALGADSIEDCQVLRAARTGRLLGGWMPAASTLGTFLRAFTFGHVRQLDRVLAETLKRAWTAGAGPGEERLTIDVDSFVGEVHGYDKQGAAFGYTRKRGYHPPRQPRGERRGAAPAPAQVVSEHAARDPAFHRRADRARQPGRRQRREADARRLGILKRQGVRQARAGRLDVLDRCADGQARPRRRRSDRRDGVDDNRGLPRHGRGADRRNAPRRPPADRAPHAPLSAPKPSCFRTGATSRLRPTAAHPVALVEAEQRQHAVVELVIRDLNDQALAHFPSGHFHANGAWTVIGALAHNLLRRTELLGAPGKIIRAARTVRRRLLAMPGRLTTHAAQWTLHLPARWPCQQDFNNRAHPPSSAPRRHLTAPATPTAQQTTHADTGAITAAREPSTTAPRRTRDPPEVLPHPQSIASMTAHTPTDQISAPSRSIRTRAVDTG
jgi:hypothetical protein